MASNPYVNKVEFGNTVVMDLTADTVTEESLEFGITAHDHTGAPIVGTGGAKLTKDITSNIEVGGIKSNTTYVKGTKIEDVIENLLVKYLVPTLSFGISPNTSPVMYETIIPNVTMSCTVGKKSNDIQSIDFRVNGTSVHTETSGVAGGGSFSYVYNTPISNTTSFSIVVDDGRDGASSSRTITFCNPSFFGTVADTVTTVTESDIKSLANKRAINSRSLTYNNITMTYGKILYAYPQSFGSLTSVKDGNNIECLASYTKQSVNVTVDGVSVPYFAYILTDATGVTNIKQIYS